MSSKVARPTGMTAGILAGVRLSDFWARMEASLGAAYAQTYARDQVLNSLGGRSIAEALSQGEDVQRVWRAVWAHLELPESER